jgi:threonine dehydrogenase-like Zn-dependent dehydrogenase
MIHPIPDSVSFEDGAMMEPLSVGVHSVANLGEFKSDQVSLPLTFLPSSSFFYSGT